MEKLELIFTYEKETRIPFGMRSLAKWLTAAGMSLLALSMSSERHWGSRCRSG